MSGKPSKLFGAVGLMVLTITAVTLGTVLLIADYAVGAADAVRKRLRAITKV